MAPSRLREETPHCLHIVAAQQRAQHQHLAETAPRDERHAALLKHVVDGREDLVSHRLCESSVNRRGVLPGDLRLTRRSRQSKHAPGLARLDAVVEEALGEFRGSAAALQQHVEQTGPRAAAHHARVLAGHELDLQQTLREAESGIGELRDQVTLGVDCHQDLLSAVVRANLTKRYLAATNVDDHRARHPRAKHSLVLRPRLLGQLLAGRPARYRASREAALAIEQDRVGLDQLTEPPDKTGRGLLSEQRIEKMLLQRDAAPQAMHVARGKGVEHVACDLAEGGALRDPDERQALLIGGIKHDRGDLANVGHDGHADAHHTILLEEADKARAAFRVALEARLRGKQEAALHHPRRRVLEIPM